MYGNDDEPGDEIHRSAACHWRAMMMLDAFRPRPASDLERYKLAKLFEYGRGDEFKIPQGFPEDYLDARSRS